SILRGDTPSARAFLQPTADGSSPSAGVSRRHVALTASARLLAPGSGPGRGRFGDFDRVREVLDGRLLRSALAAVDLLARLLCDCWRGASPRGAGRFAMKVAVLERFADVSRRCAPETIGGGQDELTVWNLIGDWNGWRNFVAKLLTFLGEPISVSDRIRLLVACLGTEGAQKGALDRALELVRGVRARQIQLIACFSTEDFALAASLV